MGKMMINPGIIVFWYDFQTNPGLNAGWQGVEGSNMFKSYGLDGNQTQVEDQTHVRKHRRHYRLTFSGSLL